MSTPAPRYPTVDAEDLANANAKAINVPFETAKTNLTRAQSAYSLDRLISDKGEIGLLTAISERVSEGLSYIAIAKALGVNPVDLRAWINSDETRADYINACLEVYADYLVCQTIKIADDGSAEDVPRDKLRVDARWKLAQSLHKSRFQDKDAKGGNHVTIVLANPLDAKNMPIATVLDA